MTMASMQCPDLAKLITDMGGLASIDTGTLDEMLSAEADVVIEAQKSTARSMGVHDTGKLISSITKTKTYAGKGDTLRCIYVRPEGYRDRGGYTTSNTEIAFINEFGKHGQAARPFIRTANEQAADQAVQAAAKIYDDYLSTKDL